MSKVKSEVSAPEADGIAKPDTTALAAVANGNTALASVGDGMSFGSVDLGDDTNAGASRPTATIHVSHNLSEKEPQGCIKGSVWLARKTDTVWPCKIADPGKRFNMVPFSVGHVWREVIEFGSDVIPRVFRTKDAAIAAGLRPDFGANISERRNCVPVYCMWVLIEQPEGVSDESMFFFDLDGKRYAPAEVYVDKYRSYNSLKATLQSAMAIVATKFGAGKRDISAITLSASTSFADVKLATGVTRKIPYLMFDTAKDGDGVVMFTTDAFRRDLSKFIAIGDAPSAE